ncbi:triose-phosphate isomerase [Desulfovibrio ferrophilus]|uniref:Triosephosphate isomerase n=1 Tax=Desulfovibrio ferrophilus TaxID=241368 RepID=A0A2Z6AWQ8_9BACT|nr:triose-phosphate isomerase [Desulfovibrio ferrophilus]BBD07650.1 triosephosphate isomerase [Desulfovibrio ferrophilus]
MKKLMAANWKMFKTVSEALETAEELVRLCGDVPADREVLVIPPFTAMTAVAGAFEHAGSFFLGGQNFYPELEGAFTGEISPVMLKDACCSYALAGHSERRHVLGEDDATVGRKTAFGLEQGLSMILCVGELIEERRAGKVEEVLRRQLQVGLADVPRDVLPERLSVAYEPVWAIGTGEVAGPEEIVQAHDFVRSVLVEIFGVNGNEMRIQYGGSVKPGNASDIISLDNVDGVLVGGASLKADSFSQIVLAG